MTMEGVTGNVKQFYIDRMATVEAEIAELGITDPSIVQFIHRVYKRGLADEQEGLSILAGFHSYDPSTVSREKTSTGSAQAESGSIPEGAIGKTVGLSYGAEANS